MGSSPFFSWYEMGPDRKIEDLSAESLRKLRFTNRLRKNFPRAVEKILNARKRDESIIGLRSKIVGSVRRLKVIPFSVRKRFVGSTMVCAKVLRVLNGTARGGRYAYGKSSD